MKGSLCRAGYLLAGILGIAMLAGCPPVVPTVHVTVTPDSADVEVGQTISLAAESTDAADATFAWESSDEGVVAVEQADGVGTTIRGVAAGTATVTATGSNSDVVGSAVITVPEEDVVPGTIQPALLAPGLNVTVQSVVIPADRRPEVTFTATNDKGQTLALSELSSVRFILDHMQAGPVGGTPQFASYTTNSSGQATYDSAQLAGLTQMADGTFKYKFAKVLPADYDVTAVHQVGGQMARLYAIDGQQYPANPIFTFRPDNELPVVGRAVVQTETCNHCHTRLGLHGGQRREIQLCILCHEPQSVDPESGNTVDMKVMIHKIHMGENLPSVEAGTPYQIIGHQNSVNDYSEVAFPQAVSNCTACHDSSLPQGNAFLTNPTIETCGSCHDRTWFGNPTQTPAGFTNHPLDFEQTDSHSCTLCHTPTAPGVAPITEAHAAVKGQGLLMDIVSVTPNAETGGLQIQFSLTDGEGTPITDVRDLQRANALVAWPASDYQNSISETIGGARAITGAIESYTSETGVYNYTFAATLPANSTDTFAVALTGRIPVETPDGEVEVGTDSNGLTFFTLDGSEPTPRRDVVANERCDACHNEIRGHGEQRFGVEVCVMCHRPNNSDDGTTINFKDMIHKIHTGAEAENPYPIGDFSDVEFPGDRRVCTMCHLEDTFLVPLPEEALPTVITETETMIPPTRAACTSCHDSTAADTHAYLASNAQGVESCEVCHGEDADFAVSLVHTPAP